MLNSVVLSLLIVFLNIQNQSMHIDYLTGINNRKRLEAYLKQKVSTSNENKTFSAIMIVFNIFSYWHLTITKNRSKMKMANANNKIDLEE